MVKIQAKANLEPWYSYIETWKKELLNTATLLDFPKVIGPHGSNYDREISHFLRGLGRFFHNVSFLQKKCCFWLQCIMRLVITSFKSWLQNLVLLLGAWYY